MSSFLVIKKNLELSAGTGAKMLVGKQNRAIPVPSSPLPYDSEIEYIESTGTQWIDTGIVPTEKTSAKMKVYNVQYTGNVIFGYYNSSDSSDWRFFNASQDMYFDCYSERISKSSGWTSGSWREFEIGNNYVKDLETGNTIVSGTTRGSFTGTRTITLNNFNNSSFSKNKWAYVKIYENNILVRDMIPVRVDQVGYMYDKVSEELFENKGSGNFTLGNDVQSEQSSSSSDDSEDYVIVTTMKKHFEFDISYDVDPANGQSVSSFQAKFPSGKYDPLSSTPSYAHHWFLGWHTQVNDASNEYAVTSGDQKTSNDNVDCFIPALYGNWQAATSVMLSSQMQDWNPEIDHDCFVGQQYGQLPSQAQYQNYRFLGWYTQQRTPDKTATTAGSHITSTSLVSYRPTLYALWQLPTEVQFDATTNGGEMPSAWVQPNYYADQPYEILPQPTHPRLSFGGWYLSGNLVDETSIVPLSGAELVAQYVSQMYTVDMNGEWQLEPSLNPDSTQFNGAWKSFSNSWAEEDETMAKIYINVVGYRNFSIYIGSNSEQGYDYTVAMDPDIDPSYPPYDSEWDGSSEGVKASTSENTWCDPTDLNTYVKVDYQLDGGSHRICVVYRKDSSVSEGDDCGYLVIPKPASTDNGIYLSDLDDTLYDEPHENEIILEEEEE